MKSRNLCNYYRDEVNDGVNETDDDYRINNSKTTTSQSFEYESKLTESTPACTNRLHAEVVITLNFE